MGSIARYSQIERFIESFGEKISDHFQTLVGLTIEELKDVTVSYYVKGVIRLSNNDEYPVHYRWSGVEEDHEKKETDEDFEKMEDYYTKHLVGKTILSVRVGHADRDDEVYLLAHVSDEHCLEIPIGFDPERCEFSDIAESVLDETEIQNYIKEKS